MRAEDSNCRQDAVFFKQLIRNVNEKLIAEKMLNYGIQVENDCVTDSPQSESVKSESESELTENKEKVCNGNKKVKVYSNQFKEKLKSQIKNLKVFTY